MENMTEFLSEIENCARGIGGGELSAKDIEKELEKALMAIHRALEEVAAKIN